MVDDVYSDDASARDRWLDEVRRAAADDVAEAFNRDPWGADRTAAEDGRALAEQVVSQSARIRTLEAALAVERAAKKHAAAATTEAETLRGELAIRKFLDDLAEQGLPSTLYQTFSPDYRQFIGRRLIFWADTANRMLGEFHNLPPAAIAHRDALYADADGESEGLTLKNASQADLEEMLGRLSDLDDDDEDDR